MNEPKYKIDDIVLANVFNSSFYAMIIAGPLEECNGGYVVIDEHGQKYGVWDGNITPLSKETQSIMRKIIFGLRIKYE